MYIMYSVIMFLNSHLPPKPPCRGLCFRRTFPPNINGRMLLSPESLFFVCIFHQFSIFFQSARNPTNFPTFAQPFCMVLLWFTSWSVELRERGGPFQRHATGCRWCGGRFTLGYGWEFISGSKIWGTCILFCRLKGLKVHYCQGSNAEPVWPIQPVLSCRIL